MEFKHTKKQEGKKEKREVGEKKTFKGTAKAVSLAKQLSPRAQRKKEKLLNSTAQLKVGRVTSHTRPRPLLPFIVLVSN